METIKGKFFWKKRWYSFCGAHQKYDEKCNLCQCGNWHNVWLMTINEFFHDHCYYLWYWWATNI